MAQFNTAWIKKKIDGVLTKCFAIAHAKSTYMSYSENKTVYDAVNAKAEQTDLDDTNGVVRNNYIELDNKISSTNSVVKSNYQETETALQDLNNSVTSLSNGLSNTDSVVKANYLEIEEELQALNNSVSNLNTTKANASDLSETNDAVTKNANELETLKSTVEGKSDSDHKHSYLIDNFDKTNTITYDGYLNALQANKTEVVSLGTSGNKYKDGYFSGTVHATAIEQNGELLDNTYVKKAYPQITGGLRAVTADGDYAEMVLNGMISIAADGSYLDAPILKEAGTKLSDKYLKIEDAESDYAKKYNSRLTGTTYIDDGIVAAEEETDMEGNSVYTQKGLWLNGNVLISADGKELDAEVLKQGGVALDSLYGVELADDITE